MASDVMQDSVRIVRGESTLSGRGVTPGPSGRVSGTEYNWPAAANATANAVLTHGTGPVPQVYSYKSSDFKSYVAQGLVMKQLLDLTKNHPNVPFEILEVFFPPGESSDVHSKPTYEIMYVVDGVLGLTSGGKRFVAEKYCGIVIPPNVLHQHHNLGQDMLRFIMIHLSPDGYANAEGAVRAHGDEVVFFGHRGKNIQEVLQGPVNLDM